MCNKIMGNVEMINKCDLSHSCKVCVVFMRIVSVMTASIGTKLAI